MLRSSQDATQNSDSAIDSLTPTLPETPPLLPTQTETNGHNNFNRQNAFLHVAPVPIISPDISQNSQGGDSAYGSGDGALSDSALGTSTNPSQVLSQDITPPLSQETGPR